MSLTTTLICLSTYLGIPTDITNQIVQYSAEYSDRWIVQYDSRKEIYRKVNVIFFDELAFVCDEKLLKNTSFSIHSLIVNATRYDSSETQLQHRYQNKNGDFEWIFYTKNEISPNKFEYYWIVCCVGPYSTPLHPFCRGTVYRPYEEFSWNRQQTITSYRMEDNTMYISHTEFQVEHAWNIDLNMNELVVDVQIGDGADILWTS